MNHGFELASTIDCRFRITRLIDQDFVSSECRLELVIHIDPSSTSDHSIILKCMRWWLDSVLDQSVCYSVQNTAAPLDTISWCNNNVIMAPEEPNDWLLLVMICAKLNAIGEGCVRVISAKMSTNTGNGFGNVFTGDPLELLPETQDWVGLPAFRDQPWWNRPDGGTIDIKLTGDEQELPASIEIDIRSRFNVAIGATPVAEIIRPNFGISDPTHD